MSGRGNKTGDAISATSSPGARAQSFAGCPTPWTVVDREQHGIEIRAADGDPVIACFDANTVTHAETEQIARLIAAAPTMLAALQHACLTLGDVETCTFDSDGSRDAARGERLDIEAIIAKAEGREL